MYEWHALAPAQWCSSPTSLHTYPVGHAGGLRSSVYIDVEQGLVIVRFDVGDILLRVEVVTGGRAVVVHLSAGHQVAVSVDEGIVRQVAGHTHLDLVGLQKQRVELLSRCAGDSGFRIIVHAVGEALLLQQPLPAVERSDAAHGIPRAVVEGADAGARQVSWVAFTPRALSATSPKFQPSPYM